MVEGGAGPSFPVVFFDGEREMDVGDVRINPTLEYKPFQHMLGAIIGISPNQISIYLVDRRRPFKGERRRIPITGKVNFGLICGQRDCCFLVVLKRSRRARNRRERTFSPPMNVVLLRRNWQDPFYVENALPDLNRIQREDYQMAMGKGGVVSIPNRSVDLVSGRLEVAPVKNGGSGKAFCGECVDKVRNGSTAASFHSCVNDAVISGRFTASFGPVSRPYGPVHL